MSRDEPAAPRRGASDATEYSSTKAPETRREAEEAHEHPSDYRLIPGGQLGSPADPGMSSLDRDVAVSEGRSPEQQDFGRTEDREPR